MYLSMLVLSKLLLVFRSLLTIVVWNYAFIILVKLNEDSLYRVDTMRVTHLFTCCHATLKRPSNLSEWLGLGFLESCQTGITLSDRYYSKVFRDVKF